MWMHCNLTSFLLRDIYVSRVFNFINAVVNSLLYIPFCSQPTLSVGEIPKDGTCWVKILVDTAKSRVAF